jgi:hypothetical protein
MRITREMLIRIAKETAQKRALSDPDLVAAYLTGSLRSENPFIGNSTDIDIVLVHAGKPKVRREIIPLTPEIHLDLVHNPRSEYEKPKELRIHPWLGPQLYDPLPLYGTRHFFEFVQAGVRAGYDEPANVLARARCNADHARQIWTGLQLSQETGPALLLSYLKSVDHAANAVALLTGGPLAERRFMLQFDLLSKSELAGAAGVPGLSAGLLGLVGGGQLEAVNLAEFLTGWEKSFVEACNREHVHASIAAPRLVYYKHAFEAMLAGGSPQAVLWPLIHTWTLAASVLPPTHQSGWLVSCETLGLAGDAFSERVEGLDHFLDAIEELLDNWASSHGA